MSSSDPQLGDLHALQAARGRVILLSQFLEQDWHQESPLWLKNSILELAEATTQLAMQEVGAAGIVAVPSVAQPHAPMSVEDCKQRVIAFAHQLTAERDSGARISLSLQLAHATAVLARAACSP